MIYRAVHCMLFLLFLGSIASVPLRGQSITWDYLSTPPHAWTYELAANAEGDLFCVGESVFISKDGGISWTELPSTGLILPSWIHIAADDALYIGGMGGVVVSRDMGRTWKVLESELVEGMSFVSDIVTASDGTLLISVDNRGWKRSTDKGETWEVVLECNYPYAGREGPDGALFVSVRDSGKLGIYKSTDGGKSWTLSGLPTVDYIREICVSAEGTIIAAAHEREGKGRVFRSGDGGKSWSSTTLKDICPSVISVAPGEFYASAANSGVYYSSDDGKTWTSVGSGLFDSRVFPLIQHPDGHLILCDAFGRIFRTSNSVLSVADVGSSSPVHSVTPSPAIGSTLISAAGFPPGTASVVLFDAVGRIVQETAITIAADGSGTLPLDLALFPAGVYFYSISGNGTTAHGRFVVAG